MLGALAVAMALGIAAAAWSEAPVWLAWAPGAAGALLCLRVRSRSQGALLLALAAGFHAQAARLADSRAGLERDPRAVEIEGVVARRAGAWNPRWLDLAGVRGAGVPRVRVYANEPADLDPWLPGDRLRARLRLAPLGAARNPGNAASGARHARAGLGTAGALVHPSWIVARSGGPTRRLHAVRRRAARALDAAGPGSGLLRGLALGERDAVAPNRREAFVRLGLAHALAVSGLHLAWVAAASYGLARVALARCAFLAARVDTRRVALVPAAGVAIAYALLSGAGVPARRALLLLLVAALAAARVRPQRAGAPLGAAALWILSREPDALFLPGAQLSFAAVAAFVAARGAPLATLPRSRTRLALDATLRRSATAIVATAPILAWHGGGVSAAALAANLLALPWLGAVVLPAALLAAGFAAGELPGADALARAAAWSADATGRILEHGAASLPPLDRAPPGFAGWLAVAGSAALGLATRSTGLRVAAALWIALLLGALPAAPLGPPTPRLVVLDVGQGDAALLQGRSGALLVDAGGARAGWDAGARRVVPALRALGVARLDLVVATHADLDHRGGLPAVLAAIPVTELWLPRGGGADPDFDAVRRAARAAGTRLREVGRGHPQRRIGDLLVEPLWPPRDGAGGDSRNARSLVVRVAIAGGHRVLLPGDLDAAAERELLRREPDLRAAILLLPHHGSRGSSSAAFLEAVAPSLALASAPCRSRFGMPHPEVRERLAERGIALGWTGRDGALRIALAAPLRALGTGRPARCPEAPPTPRAASGSSSDRGQAPTRSSASDRGQAPTRSSSRS